MIITGVTSAAEYISPSIQNFQSYICMQLNEQLPGASYTVDIDASEDGSMFTNYASLQVSVTGNAADTFADTDVNDADDEITLTAHGLKSGDRIYYLDGTSGSIPGLTDATNYYAIKVDANTIKVAANYENAINGIAIDLGAAAVNADYSFTKAQSSQWDSSDLGQFRFFRIRINVSSGTFSGRLHHNGKEG